MFYEKDLPVDESGSWTGYLRGVDADGNSVLVPRILFYAGGSCDAYLGSAYFNTDPGTPECGFWICMEDEEGTYVYFGGQTANKLDRFYWNSTNQVWDLIPYSWSTTMEPFRDEATGGQTSATLPYDLTTKSLVFINGALMPPSEYSGIGTKIITFNAPLLLFDRILVTF